MTLHREARPDAMPAKIYTVEPTGDLTYVHVRLGEHLVVASAPANFRAAFDEPIWLSFDQNHLHLFDAATQMAMPPVGGSSFPSSPREEALTTA